MPLPSVPTVSDFQEALHPIIQLPANNKPTNAIVFLPGLGDTSENFSNFAKALNLPDAVTITLQPICPIPLGLVPGFQWSEDIQVDTSTGSLDPDSPLNKASDLVSGLISQTLVQKHNFTPAAVHIFGYGQGGSLALTAVLHPSLAGLGSIGSVISIGGALPLAVNHTSNVKSRTPILLLGGRNGDFAKNDRSAVKRLKTLCEFVQYHEWKKSESTMPVNREEAMPMMQFLAMRLRNRRGVPDDFIEVT
jgi:predicted esterase